jgi:hypothetical protein
MQGGFSASYNEVIGACVTPSNRTLGAIGALNPPQGEALLDRRSISSPRSSAI